VGGTPNVTTEDAEIRSLIERWAAAVRNRDLEGILRHHAPDILMFDVPPPVRSQGINAYKDTWDLFFSASLTPVVFDIVEMHVTASAEVGFVAAVMRCHDRKDGELIFRLTVGLRKIGHQWIVTHEHHSLPAR
jgi:ketosteroid isomerase-like protein